MGWPALGTEDAHEEATRKSGSSNPKATGKWHFSGVTIFALWAVSYVKKFAYRDAWEREGRPLKPG